MLAEAGQPNAPEVGSDGIVDKELEQEIINYSHSIEGSSIESWRGEFLHVTWIDGAWLTRPPYYSVGILMEEPPSGFKPARNVELRIYEVTAEQEAESKALQYRQSVVFGGTILAVNAFGEVFVENGSIRPVD